MTDETRVKSRSSGQLLLVAAFAIAILISSTVAYVYEFSKVTIDTRFSDMSEQVFALKQCVRNVVTGSLANISNGGQYAFLGQNLDKLSDAFGKLCSFGMCKLHTSLLNDLSYDSGICLLWNTSGHGISSAYADIVLNVYGMEQQVNVSYSVNVTTLATLTGFYATVGGNEKLLNLTCKVYNDAKPALVNNLTICYEDDDGNWRIVDEGNGLVVIDGGEGTYDICFSADVSSGAINISAHIFDLRGIYVQANVTCFQG